MKINNRVYVLGTFKEIPAKGLILVDIFCIYMLGNLIFLFGLCFSNKLSEIFHY